jgi:hypothetical protein
MNHSGDAAEQIVRISLEGVDYAIRITGSAAKNIAAFLLAALRSDGMDGKTKLRGKERLVKMLKSGKETKIFAIKNSDLKQFETESRRYGVTYCVLKEKTDNPNASVEIMAKAEDASKISRIMDNLEFAAVSIGSAEAAPEKRESGDRDDTDKLLDELLGDDKDKAEQSITEKGEKALERGQTENPTYARDEKEHPSEPRSETPLPSAGDTQTKKPESVKEFLRERTQTLKKQEEKKRDYKEPLVKKSPQKGATHQQPPNRVKKRKMKKER